MTPDEKDTIIGHVQAALTALKSSASEFGEAVRIDDPKNERKGDRELRLLYEQALDVFLQTTVLIARLESELPSGTPTR